MVVTAAMMTRRIKSNRLSLIKILRKSNSSTNTQTKRTKMSTILVAITMSTSWSIQTIQMSRTLCIRTPKVKQKEETPGQIVRMTMAVWMQHTSRNCFSKRPKILWIISCSRRTPTTAVKTISQWSNKVVLK